MLPVLRCPVCGDGFTDRGTRSEPLRCGAGHAFDVARQGYVTLTAKPIAHPGDTAEMVMARERLQVAGWFDPLRDAVAGLVAPVEGVVVDVGAGTGHLLAGVVGRAGAGVALDSSVAASRRAARAHERVAAVRCDVTRPLPVADACAEVVLVAFAPRPADELVRIAAPTGRLVVVVPAEDHLAEVRDAMGMLSIPADKPEAIAASLEAAFRLTRTESLSTASVLTREHVIDVAGMGPGAFHTTAEQRASRAAALPAAVEVTQSLRVLRFEPR